MNTDQISQKSSKVLHENRNKKEKKSCNCFLAADSCWLLSTDHLFLRNEAHSLAGGISVQVAKAWVSHCNASSCSHQKLASETLQAWKKGLSQGCWKRNIYSFCLEEPAVFKPHADHHDADSWKIQCCLCSAGESATIFFSCISVQHIALRTGLLEIIRISKWWYCCFCCQNF